jgi:hypothetical protein
LVLFREAFALSRFPQVILAEGAGPAHPLRLFTEQLLIRRSPFRHFMRPLSKLDGLAPVVVTDGPLLFDRPYLEEVRHCGGCTATLQTKEAHDEKDQRSHKEVERMPVSTDSVERLAEELSSRLLGKQVSILPCAIRLWRATCHFSRRPA